MIFKNNLKNYLVDHCDRDLLYIQKDSSTVAFNKKILKNIEKILKQTEKY